MEPHAVVKAGDPFKDGRARFGVCRDVPTMEHFATQGAPEAFHGGVVTAVPPADHAAAGRSSSHGLGQLFAAKLQFHSGVLEVLVVSFLPDC